MRLLVVFVTAHAAVLDTVTERRVSLVPSDLRAKNFAALGGDEVVLSGYRVTNQSTIEDVLEHVKTLGLETASGVVLLTDGSLPGLMNRLGDVFAVNQFAAPAFGRDPANILSSTLAKCLRTFRYYKTRFDDGKYHRILRLPLRNFAAPEVGTMRELCHDMMNGGNFGRQLDRLLQLFRQRQHPKKASSYPDVYLVDDDQKHFSLGHEVHARAETACPPHDAVCVFGNSFRFGRAFDGTRHYNVSRDGNALMTSNYFDCHGVERSGKGAQHLNMFTNDFF